MSIQLKRTSVILRPDQSRVLLRPFSPGDARRVVLSHGVGPVRKYCIGAFLLDRNDPSKVVGRLREPLIKPSESERVGYVPNVVYTCGALVHKDELLIPYAMADHGTGFATVPLAEVLAAMHPEGC